MLADPEYRVHAWQSHMLDKHRRELGTQELKSKHTVMLEALMDLICFKSGPGAT